MKPKFIRQDRNKFKKLGDKWRKPKGLHSKTRNCFRGHESIVSVGWKSPADSRGLIDSLENVVVFTLKEVEGINPKIQGISIANAVGLKRRIELIAKAKERGIRIINIKNADEYIARQKEKKAKRKKDIIKKDVKEVKPKAKEKEEPKKEATAEQKAPEAEKEKSEKDKEEYEKILTKRN